MKRHKHRPPRAVRIDRFDARGGGQGVDAFGRTWSVRGAPVGATILAGGRAHDGVRLQTLEPAPDAVEPRCAVFGVCGGCQWQEMSLPRQREEKGRMLARLYADLGGVDHGVLGGSDAGYGYRNKIELTFGTGRYLLAHELNTEVKRGGRWLGFHAPGRYDRIVDTPDCALASPAINAVYARIRRDIQASGLPFWDADAHTGFFRNLVLREGSGHGEAEVLVAVYTAPGGEVEAGWLRAHAPGWGAACVGWFENATVADAVGGELREVLVESGRGLAVSARLTGLRFTLSTTAFFQANAPGAEEMIRVVRGFLPARSRRGVLWDLYCGSGLFGLALAAEFDEVVGIEAVEAAVVDARRNAVENGVANARFVAGSVEALAAGLLAEGGAPAAIIVDPPRNGLHPDAVKVLGSLASPSDTAANPRGPVLVYVACKPTSLLRDAKLLQAAGWTCTDRVAIDLFPQTAHVEVVSRWVPRGAPPGP